MRTARKTLLMVVVGIVVVASSARVHSSQSTSTTEPYPYQIGHTRDLLFVAWSQDSTRLISYSWADAAVLVWNVKDGRLITSFNKDFVGHPGDITWGAGMSLTTLNNNAMEVRDNLTNALLWRIVRQGPSTSTSPDGALIAEGGRYGDACITIRDARSGAFIRRLEGHPGIVRGLAFSPDGRFVASANGDRTVVIRDSHSGKVVTVLPGNEKPIDSVAFNRDGQKIAVGGDDGTLRIWRTETSSIIWSSKVDRAPVNSVTFSRDGETLASGGGDRVIRIWNATDGHLLSECTTVGEYSDEHTTECCGSSVNALAFSPSGMDIAAGLGDGSIEIWNVSTGKLAFNKQSDKEGRIHAIHFESESLWRWISAGADHSATVCSADGKCIKLEGEESKYAYAASLSPDGRFGATGSIAGEISIWNLSTGRRTGLIDASDEVLALIFSPDGRFLASGGEDQTVRVWDALTGKILWDAAKIN